MSITTQDATAYIGQNLYDNDGSKVGKIGGVFVDDTTGQPDWITVSTGFFGTNESFVPIDDVDRHEDGLRVPFGKDQIKNAPNVDLDGGHLSPDEEQTLYQHYGRSYDAVKGQGYGQSGYEQRGQGYEQSGGYEQTGYDQRGRDDQGRPATQGRPRKTAEELDAEMADYWGTGNETTGGANQGNGTAAAPNPAPAAAPPPAGDADVEMIP